MNAHQPIPKGSCPLCEMAEDRFFNTIIAISPGLDVEFQGRLSLEVQYLIFCFCQVLCTIYENILPREVFKEHLFQSNK